MAKSKLTKRDKVSIVANMPEVTNAIKVLTALMEEAKIKEFIEYDYIINGKKYRFKYQRIT